MFIVTKLIHIKLGYEEKMIRGLQQYYPNSGTYGFINLEFPRTKRTEHGNEYMIRILWKTQQDYHEWIAQKQKTPTIPWTQQFQSYILSSRSNATHVKYPY
ncbi:antibiotic biosynthesis monooxygenase family protein [Bacillus sp. C1]